MKSGEIDVLNVGAGHLKIEYSKADAIERERARRMVTDMLRRGYSLFVEVEGGELALVKEFDAEREVYIVSDVPARSDEAEPRPRIPAGVRTAELRDDEPEPLPSAPETALCAKCLKPKHRGRCTKEIPMRTAKVTAVGRSAGG